MKKNAILKTNLLVCLIITVGFTITSVISYRSNIGLFQKDAEMVSTLTSDGLYQDISNIFDKPIGTALTMANDTLLRDFLLDEQHSMTNPVWQRRMRDYLNAYRLKYQYDSVFLVSAATNNYYHFEGLDRVLTPENPENTWYHTFLGQDEDYSMNVDNDEATDNSVTVFVNCRVRDENGATLGVVGVGLRVDPLQTLLASYEEQYGVRAFLVNGSGIVEASTSTTGYEGKNLSDLEGFAQGQTNILQNDDARKPFCYSSESGDRYVVTQYEPNLKWHLVVENDTAVASQQMNALLLRSIAIIAAIVLLVLVTITVVLRRFNARILDLTVSQELEYQHLMHEMTEGLYEDIFELDITRNRASGEATKKYFEGLGISGDTPYDKALYTIAGNEIKAEYVQGYLDMFSSDAVLRAFHNGITNLSYDFMITRDSVNYHWVRISARIFYWNSDQSVRMITYRMNVDAEKKRELLLLETVQRDSMTGLYNKGTTERLMTEALTAVDGKETQPCAFLIFDIDNFKTVNDTLGHSFGDTVINEMAGEIKTFFRESDITGRIGGDEFAVLMKNFGSVEGLREKLARLCKKIQNKNFGEGDDFLISCSIGVALSPKDGTTYRDLYEKADQALYYAKSHGKSSFAIFGESTENHSFRFHQRDLEALMNAATDGLAQFACTNPLRLLYFNQKCVDLFGVPTAVLTSSEYDPIEQIHPDDRDEALAAIGKAAQTRNPFVRTFRALRQDGSHIQVTLNGVFVNELYENKYPVFYVMYSRQDTD